MPASCECSFSETFKPPFSPLQHPHPLPRLPVVGPVWPDFTLSGQKFQVTPREAKGWKRLEGVVAAQTPWKPLPHHLRDHSSVLILPGQQVLWELTPILGQTVLHSPPPLERGVLEPSGDLTAAPSLPRMFRSDPSRMQAGGTRIHSNPKPRK